MFILPYIRFIRKSFTSNNIVDSVHKQNTCWLCGCVCVCVWVRTSLFFTWRMCVQLFRSVVITRSFFFCFSPIRYVSEHERHIFLFCTELSTYFHKIFQKHPKLLPLGTSPAYDTVILINWISTKRLRANWFLVHRPHVNTTCDDSLSKIYSNTIWFLLHYS